MRFVEATMTEPLKKWLKRQDYRVYTEVSPRLAVRAIDMVGHREKDDSIVAIEMKKNLTIKSDYRYSSYRISVFHQAQWCQRFTQAVYCAVLSQPKKEGLEKCREAGIGVLRVDTASGMVHRLVEPWGRRESDQRSSEALLHAIEHSESGGVAGMPNQRGIGPAQATYNRLVEYKKKHPDAKWEQIYDEVPNHYAHAQSMRQSMEKIEMWRAADGILENEPLFNGTRRLLKE